MSNPIRVVIVDDHDMVRRGLAAILRINADLLLVGEANDGRGALEVCEQTRPDVILMDLVMPEMDGATATRAIREQCPHVQVLVLTSYKEKELVEGALEAGAIGYLLKNVSAEELADAIRQAHAGRPTLAPEVAQVLTQAEQLERLARAVIDAPPDASTLPKLLRSHVPGMIPDSRVEIRILPEQVLLRHPADWLPVPDRVWQWLSTGIEAHCFLPGAALPWGGQQPSSEGLIVAPITEPNSREPLGGIYFWRRRSPGGVADSLPVIKSLAAQISSALHGAKVYAQTLEHEKVARELAMAGQIQASFLPTELPEVAGWQIAATLEPARETSGDFYDLISLPGGRLGIAIADAADKGVGAALYMALCRTLIRTFAAEHPTSPDLVLGATNRRILSDAHAGLFVTVFYGILDPATGKVTYCNAGHNPPYLLGSPGAEQVQRLDRTGMALGVLEDETWTRRTVQLEPGDLLLLYTDGVPEAQDLQGRFFGRERLVEVVLATMASAGSRQQMAENALHALIAQVHQFMGDAPQFDDITL
ncbi:SpoIIE family protein phosphatase, partial [Chloroflexota bacterium]